MDSLSTFKEGNSSSSLIGDEGLARQRELNCSICMKAPTDPVLAASGQVYCLPCIYRWVLNCPPNQCLICRHIYDAGACNATSMACAQVVADIPPGPNNSLLGASNARFWADERMMQKTLEAEIQNLQRRNSIWEQVVDRYEAEIQNLQRSNSLWEQVADKNEARFRILGIEMANELSRRLERANELSRVNAKLQERLERAK